MNFVKDLRDLLAQLSFPLGFNVYKFSPVDLTALMEEKQTCQRFFDILTYNVECNTAQNVSAAEKVAMAITQSNADVILLQETNPTWELKLSCLVPVDSAQGGRYPYRYFHHPTGRPAGGLAVFSVWPISASSVLDLTGTVEGSVFPVLVVNICIGAGEKMKPSNQHRTISVANVHLRPPLELDGSASLSTARTTSSIRDAEARELLRSHPGGFDVVAGDFNEQDGGLALLRLASDGGLSNALAEHVPARKETHRWPFFFGTMLRKRLDHIMYARSKLLCLGCGVMTGYEEGASDHQPVLARLAF